MVELRIGDEHLELSWDEWEARVRSGRVPPTALVRFEPATGRSFVPAETLELYHSLRDDGAIAWQGQFTAIPPLMTALLVGVQIKLWWLATWTDSVSTLVLNELTLHQQAVFEDGEVWRVFTMGFAHQAAFHVGLNLLWLGYCGWNLERALGRANLLVLYLGSVFVGSLFSMFGDPATPSLGASGGVFGLVAASIVFGFSRPHLLQEQGRRVFGWALVPYVILMFGSGLASEGTDNWAHLGGLLTGGAVALVLDPPTLQRTPRWNLAWSAGISGTMAALLALLALFGPRLSPLTSPEIAAAAGRAPVLLAPAGPIWSVPAGWKRTRNAAGDPAFASGSGYRSWAVVERTHEAPRTPEDLRDAWVAKVRNAFPDARIEEPRSDVLAGAPALHTTAVLPAAFGGERRLDHRVAARGLYSLEATWEVEVVARDRLAPLETRLRGAVTWPEPATVTTARAAFERDPDDPRARDAWATELARIGRGEEALAIRLALIEAYPGGVPYWSNLLGLIGWYPTLVDEPKLLLQRALDTHPSAAMSVAVADALDALGDHDAAVGLLDHAWNDLPGERVVRRARLARDLPVALDPAGDPWDLALDPMSGQARPADVVVATRALPLTLDAATALGRARREGRQALVAAAVAAVEAGDLEAAIDRTGWVRDGAPATTPELREEIRRDLLDAAGERPPTWMPELLVVAVRRRPFAAP